LNKGSVSLKINKAVITWLGIIAVILAGVYGIYSASSDNIDNRINQYQNVVKTVEEVELYGWTPQGESKYITNSADNGIIIGGLNCYVNNLYFDGKLDNYAEKSVKIFYITENNQQFTIENSVDALVELKGQKAYIKIDKQVAAIKIQLYEQENSIATINHVEINPKYINLSFFSLFYCISIIVIIELIIGVIIARNKITAFMPAFKKYRYLLLDLVERDLKVKYRRSVLGFLWSILNPLLMMLVITAVFSTVFRFDIKDFPVYYLTGVLVFNFVSESTASSMTSMLGAAPLIKKVYIPKYIFPLQKCLFAFVNMLFSLVAVAIVYLIVQADVHWTIILIPIPMLYAFVFSLGLSLILAAVNVFFRDVGHLYSVWITAWMYLTPIIYPISALPSSMVVFLKLNPLYYFVEYTRDIMMYGNLPTFEQNVVCIGFSLISLIIGLFTFRKFQDKFILYI